MTLRLVYLGHDGCCHFCILSTKKKTPYLADPKFLTYKGFKISDEASNGIQLWYLNFNDSKVPQFKSCAKECHIEESGFVLYYTSQCPFNAKYVPIIENLSKEMNIEFTLDKKYPNSKKRYDFYLPKYNYFIEIAGLTHFEKYREKMEYKRKTFNAIILLPNQLESFLMDLELNNM